jgi:hypothetical protein
MLYQLDYSHNTKSRIIEILGRAWPLSAKKIYNALKKDYRLGITYQAVHIALNEFLERGIVSREGREYMLSPAWIERMSSDFNALVENYTKANRIQKAKEFQELNFATLADAWDFLLSKANTGFFGVSDVCYIQIARLFAAPLSSRHILAIREFTGKTKTTLLCRRNGVIEKLVANYLNKLGVETYLGVPAASPTNTVIIGKSVISIYALYPKKEHDLLNRFYFSVKDILKQDIFTTFADLMTKNIKVKLAINQNPDVYTDVLEQTRKIIS